MPTPKELLAEANVLATKARDLLQAEDANQESLDKAAEMLQDAQAKRDQAVEHERALKKAEEFLAGQEQGRDFTLDRAPEGFKGFDDFLYTVWKTLRKQTPPEDTDPRLKWYEHESLPSERKDMAEAVGATGGFLVPPEFMPNMQSVEPEDSIVRQRATIIRMNRRQVSMPVVDQTETTADAPHWFGGLDFYWTEEAAEKTESDANFRTFTLTAHELTGYTRASDILVADSAVSLADFLSGPLGFAGGIMWMEDYAFLQGTGTGQPLGINKAGATIIVPRQADAEYQYLDFANMLSHLLPQSRSRAVWIINVAAMPDIITLNGPSGNPSFIWNPNAASGIPDTLLGRPVIWTEKLPAKYAAGDVLLADFRYYLIGDRQATTIESTTFDRWRYNQTSWKAVHRVDGRPWLNTPITLADGSFTISPFVKLGEKSS